jgi:hypothetical protein
VASSSQAKVPTGCDTVQPLGGLCTAVIVYFKSLLYNISDVSKEGTDVTGIGDRIRQQGTALGSKLPFWPAWAEFMRLMSQVPQDHVLCVVYGNDTVGLSVSPISKLAEFRMILRSAKRLGFTVEYFAVPESLIGN